MRVLDIDLDFFLTDTCPFAEEGERPGESSARPFDADTVRKYFEQNLLLDMARPLPGRVFETHDGAMYFWRDMIRAGELSAPFEVTHIDAHTDLGITQKNYPYVKMNVLGRPVEKRAEPEQYAELRQLNEANYLVFAIANRWISRLENVRNLKSKPDFPEPMRAEGGIRLESAFPALYEAHYGREPLVEYAEYGDGMKYRAEAPFDFASLAISPRYAPASADFIADIFREYITPV